MELSKKKYLDVSKDSNQKNTPFRKGYPTKIDHKAEGDTITRRNQVIKTKTKMFDFKTARV